MISSILDEGSHEEHMMVAYVFGTGAYLVLGLVVSALTIGGFNQIVGRPSRVSVPFSRWTAPAAAIAKQAALRPAARIGHGIGTAGRDAVAPVEDASDDAAGKA